MQYLPPYCYKCENYIEGPKYIGDTAKCKAYPDGIPKNIFFEGARCPKIPEEIIEAEKKKELEQALEQLEREMNKLK